MGTVPRMASHEHPASRSATDETDDDGDSASLLAGLALRNGVLIIGPTHWAASIRRSDDTIVTACHPRPVTPPRVAGRVPVLRGPLRLGGMLSILPAVRRALPEARFGFEAPEMVGGALGGSVALRWVRARHGDGPVAEATGALGSLALVLGLMRGGEVARWHGAEHKVIGGYERGEAAADTPREHPRCGTQLALPMLLAVGAATQAALRVAPSRPRTARAAGGVLGLGLAVELIRAVQDAPRSRVARAVEQTGIFLQSHGSTAEPRDDQLEVAQAALDAVLDAEPTPPARG